MDTIPLRDAIRMPAGHDLALIEITGDRPLSPPEAGPIPSGRFQMTASRDKSWALDFQKPRARTKEPLSERSLGC